MHVKSPKGSVILTISPLTNIGGVATHVRNLLHSKLALEFNMMQLDIGAPDSCQSTWDRIRRVLQKSVILHRLLCRHSGAILHLNPSMDTRALLRDMFLAIIGKLGGAKVFIQFHGGRLHQVKWLSWVPFKHLFYAILKQADLIIVLSQEQLEGIRTVLWFGVGSADRVTEAILYAPQGYHFTPFGEISSVLHNAFLSAWAEKGVFGLLLLVILVVNSFHLLLKCHVILRLTRYNILHVLSWDM